VITCAKKRFPAPAFIAATDGGEVGRAERRDVKLADGTKLAEAACTQAADECSSISWGRAWRSCCCLGGSNRVRVGGRCSYFASLTRARLKRTNAPTLRVRAIRRSSLSPPARGAQAATRADPCFGETVGLICPIADARGAPSIALARDERASAGQHERGDTRSWWPTGRSVAPPVAPTGRRPDTVSGA
jgi:hypothetical protein